MLAAAVPLGSIADIAAGNSAPQDESLFVDGRHQFFRTSDVGQIRFGDIETAADLLNDEGVKRLRKFSAGTILFPKSGASTFLNHRVMMSVDGYVSSHLATITARPQVDPRYLLYYLSTVRAQELIQDHKYPSLRLTEIEAIPVPLPPPSEQKRIVAILDEAFEGIRIATANAEKNLANARELFDAVSESLFDGAAHWQAYTLEQLLESSWIVSHLDGNHGSEYPRKEEFIADGVPYISANCIVDETVDFDFAKYLAPERADRIRKGVARDRDVLFAHNATVGPVALLRTEEPRVILGTSLTYYRCDETHILPEYLAHYMRTPLFRRQYELVMRQSTRNQVPITKQREFTHVVPPIEDQRRIAATLDELEAERQALLAGIQAKIAQASALKQSILARAFSGQLTATKGLAA